MRQSAVRQRHQEFRLAYQNSLQRSVLTFYQLLFKQRKFNDQPSFSATQALIKKSIEQVMSNQLNSLVRQLTDKLQEAQSSCKSLQSQMSRCRSERESLQRKLKMSENTIKKLSQQVQLQNVQISQLTLKLKTKSIVQDTHQKTINSSLRVDKQIKSVLTPANPDDFKQSTLLKQQLLSLRKQLESKEKQIKTFKEQLDRSNSQFENTRSRSQMKICKLQEAMIQQDQIHQRQLQKQRIVFKKPNSSQNSNQFELHLKTKLSEMQNSRFRVMYSLDIAKKQLKKSEDQYEQLRQDNQQLQAKFQSNLDQSLKIKQKYHQLEWSNNVLAQERNSYYKKLQITQSQLSQAKSKLKLLSDQLQDTKSKKRDIQLKLQRLTQSFNSLQLTFQELQANFQTSEKLVSQLSKNKIQNVQKIDALTTVSMKFQTLSQTAQKQLKVLKSKYQQLLIKSEQDLSQLKKIRFQHSSFAKQNQFLNKQLLISKESIQNSQASINNHQTKIFQLSQTNSNLTNKLQLLQKSHQSAKYETQSLRGEKQNLKSQIGQLKAEIRDLWERSCGQQTRQRQLNLSQKSLKEQVQIQNIIIGTLRSQKKQLQLEIQTRKKTLLSLKSQMQEELKINLVTKNKLKSLLLVIAKHKTELKSLREQSIKFGGKQKILASQEQAFVELINRFICNNQNNLAKQMQKKENQFSSQLQLKFRRQAEELKRSSTGVIRQLTQSNQLLKEQVENLKDDISQLNTQNSDLNNQFQSLIRRENSLAQESRNLKFKLQNVLQESKRQRTQLQEQIIQLKMQLTKVKAQIDSQTADVYRGMQAKHVIELAQIKMEYAKLLKLQQGKLQLGKGLKAGAVGL